MSRVEKILNSISIKINVDKNPFQIPPEHFKFLGQDSNKDKYGNKLGLKRTNNLDPPFIQDNNSKSSENDGKICSRTSNFKQLSQEVQPGRKSKPPSATNALNGETSMHPSPNLVTVSHKSSKETEKRIGRENKIMLQVEEYMATSKSHQMSSDDKRETTTEFVDKKRQLFLLRHSLSIKQKEIDKLGKLLRDKEESLVKSEKVIEEESLIFEKSLKENDEQSREAVRSAEKICQQRMDRVQDRKKMNQLLAGAQSGINRGKSVLEDCLAYRGFLTELTPNEWFQEQVEEKRQRQMTRRRKRIEKREEEWKCRMIEEHEERKAKVKRQTKQRQNDQSNRRRQGRRKRTDRDMERKKSPTDDNTRTMENDTSIPNFSDEEELTSSDSETPLYFQEPNQLLRIFSVLEEENLFLIQNIQEAEQSLDEMTDRFNESQNEVQRKADKMQGHINQIKNDIKMKQNSIDSIRARMEGKQVDSRAQGNATKESTNYSTGSQNREQNLMHHLTKKVKDVYLACGCTFSGTAPSMLFMLAEIEERMEKDIVRLGEMPEDNFKLANKAKEKKRREAKRALQQAGQMRAQEERNRKIFERSMQPPKKKSGKKVSTTFYRLSACSLPSSRMEMKQRFLSFLIEIMSFF